MRKSQAVLAAVLAILTGPIAAETITGRVIGVVDGKAVLVAGRAKSAFLASKPQRMPNPSERARKPA